MCAATGRRISLSERWAPHGAGARSVSCGRGSCPRGFAISRGLLASYSCSPTAERRPVRSRSSGFRAAPVHRDRFRANNLDSRYGKRLVRRLPLPRGGGFSYAAPITMTLARVLFVSKPVEPPFRDGSCCLVRELVRGGSDLTVASVLSTPSAPRIADRTRMLRVYRKPRRYAPALWDNVSVLGHVARDTEHDIWHFVFAPNPRAGLAGRWLRRLRRTPIVQTVASQPRDFDGVGRWLFGDKVIALSHYTACKLRQSGISSDRLCQVPVPVTDLVRSRAEQRDARRRIGVAPEVPLFIYAGDLEFSRGADWMAQATPELLRRVDDAVVVFACRSKTPVAADRARRLARGLSECGDRVKFVGEVGDLAALVASATAIPFVVDDLYGKVDIPYVVLEAGLLGVPTLVCSVGPVAEVREAPRAAPGDIDAIVQFCEQMANDTRARTELGQVLRRYVREQHDASMVARMVQQVYESVL